jgi:hypothetical protein
VVDWEYTLVRKGMKTGRGFGDQYSDWRASRKQTGGRDHLIEDHLLVHVVHFLPVTFSERRPPGCEQTYQQGAELDDICILPLGSAVCESDGGWVPSERGMAHRLVEFVRRAIKEEAERARRCVHRRNRGMHTRLSGHSPGLSEGA